MSSCFTGVPMNYGYSDKEYSEDITPTNPIIIKETSIPFNIDPKVVHEKRLSLNVNLNLSIESDIDLSRLDTVLSMVGKYI